MIRMCHVSKYTSLGWMWFVSFGDSLALPLSVKLYWIAASRLNTSTDQRMSAQCLVSTDYLLAFNLYVLNHFKPKVRQGEQEKHERFYGSNFDIIVQAYYFLTFNLTIHYLLWTPSVNEFSSDILIFVKVRTGKAGLIK